MGRTRQACFFHPSLAHQAALDVLWQRGFLYPCTCSRRDIAEAVSAPQEGSPAYGPDGLIYPGTCARKFSGVDLSQEPRHVERKTELRERVRAWMEATGDPLLARW